MSTLYLFDAHDNVLANSGVDDTIAGSGSGVPINGSFVVRVADDVRLDGDPPATLADLMTQKYAGLLANYPGFSYIVYDEMTDATGFSVPSSVGSTFGSRGTISIYPTGQAETVTVALATTPSECVVTWEAYAITNTDPLDDRFIREYVDRPASDLGIQASFDNGVNFTSVTDGALHAIAPGVQGNQLVLRVTNALGVRRWLGSWAVIY